MAVVFRQLGRPEEAKITDESYEQEEIKPASQLSPTEGEADMLGKPGKRYPREEKAKDGREDRSKDLCSYVAILDRPCVAFQFAVALLILEIFDQFAYPRAEEREDSESEHPQIAEVDEELRLHGVGSVGEFDGGIGSHAHGKGHECGKESDDEIAEHELALVAGAVEPENAGREDEDRKEGHAAEDDAERQSTSYTCAGEPVENAHGRLFGDVTRDDEVVGSVDTVDLHIKIVVDDEASGRDEDHGSDEQEELPPEQGLCQLIVRQHGAEHPFLHHANEDGEKKEIVETEKTKKRLHYLTI